MNFQQVPAVLKRLSHDQTAKFSSKKPESIVKYVRQRSHLYTKSKNIFLFSLIFKDWRIIDEQTEDKVHISEFNLTKLLKKILTGRYRVYKIIKT